MKQRIQQEKDGAGGQPGNQHARTHGNYSLIISPTREVLKAVAGLDGHGQRIILKYLITFENLHRMEPYSSRCVKKRNECRN